MSDVVKEKANGNKIEVGDTLRFEEKVNEFNPFSDSGSLVDPDTIEITITDYDGNKEVDAQSMTKSDTGKYYFDWDTDGKDAGDYDVEIFVKKADIKENRCFKVRLHKC